MMVSNHKLAGLFVTTFLLTNYFPRNYAQLENSTPPEVKIQQGTILGKTLTTRHGRNISSFLGIPYAQPPVGNLRFANPVAAAGWNETLNATMDPSVCLQTESSAVVGDEDCLYLNVYTPQLPQDTDSSLLPVMVYIHGGRFKKNSQSSTAVGGPDYLLDANVILVAISYRLGPLGFLSTGDEVASGNWGLKDQALALKWIQDNIRDFGGDPDQVTIFGESSGGISVHLLTLSNTTNGLFQKYITESGSALAPWGYNPRAAYSSRAFELGKYVGCYDDTSDSLISCLRNISSSVIINAESQFTVWEFLPALIWGPTDEPDIDGAFLTDSPANLFAAGKTRDLPWMSGIVRDEGLTQTLGLYVDEELLHAYLAEFDTVLPLSCSWMYQSDSGAAWTKAAKSYYFNNDFTSSTSVLLKNLTTLFSDCLFYYPARKALQQHHAHAVNPQYFYTFDYRGVFSKSDVISGTTLNYGVTHADDVIYLFPLESGLSVLNKTMSETDYQMVDSMVQLWTSFAINGTPTASALGDGITWEPYSTKDNYLRIGNDSDAGLEVQYSFFENRIQFWADIDNNSGTTTMSPNLIFLIIIACLKLVL